MKIAIAGDSAGEGLSKILADHLKDKYEVSEVSRTDAGPDAFYANLSDRVASAVMAGEYDRAILICGTGIGVQMAANKVPGIRAAQCHDTYSAGKAATSNNAQIITMGARVIGPELAKDIAEAFCHRELDLKIPEPSGVGSARDAFFHLLTFTALYTSATSLIVLFFTYIEIAFPDPAWRAVHETWAMLLVFIGLFALRFGHGRPSMMVILVASMVRELVAPIMPILAVVAWRAGRRREAVEWLAVTGMFSAFYFWHAWQVSRDVAPGALESPGWLTWRGWPGAVDAFGSSTVLTLVNPGVASAVLLLGLLGWTMRRGVVLDPIAAVVLF